MVWVLLLGYSLFLVGKSTYQNYQMSKNIVALKAQIAELEQTKRNLELSLIFYQSNSFKEVEVRRRLNLKGKDEHVVAIPWADTDASLGIVTTPVKTSPSPPPAPYIAWWQLFFGSK